eukprot:1459580-Amphidinium_carterae.1
MRKGVPCSREGCSAIVVCHNVGVVGSGTSISRSLVAAPPVSCAIVGTDAQREIKLASASIAHKN